MKSKIKITKSGIGLILLIVGIFIIGSVIHYYQNSKTSTLSDIYSNIPVNKTIVIEGILHHYHIQNDKCYGIIEENNSNLSLLVASDNLNLDFFDGKYVRLTVRILPFEYNGYIIGIYGYIEKIEVNNIG